MPIAAILSMLMLGILPQSPLKAQEAGSEAITTPRDRVENRSLGCSFELPSDGRAVVTGGDANPQIRALQRDADPPDWEIIVRSIRIPVPEGQSGKNPVFTPQSMLNSFIADAEKTNDASFEITERITDIRVDDLPSSRLTAMLGHESGRTARFEWTFIQTGPNRFLLLQFLADRDRWPTSTFEKVMESLEIKTEPELAIGSMELVDRGRAVIDGFDENAMRGVIAKLGEGIYYRLQSEDAESGDLQELGCSRLIAMETTKDAVRDSRPPNTRVDGDTGLLVWMQVRILPKGPDTPYQDVDLRAWLSWDREEEWWTIRTTVRVKGSDATRTNAVTGLRPRPLPKDPRRWLQVISGGRESFERDDRKLPVPDLDTYLSEAERLVLPELMAITRPLAGEFGAYAWNEDRLSITRRLENWLPGQETTGLSRLESRPAADALPAIQLLGPDGVLQERRTPLSGGRITWSRTDLEKLRGLYQRKGIPFDG